MNGERPDFQTPRIRNSAELSMISSVLILLGLLNKLVQPMPVTGFAVMGLRRSSALLSPQSGRAMKILTVG